MLGPSLLAASSYTTPSLEDLSLAPSDVSCRLNCCPLIVGLVEMTQRPNRSAKQVQQSTHNNQRTTDIEIPNRNHFSDARAVLIEAAIIRQSSRFSATIAEIVSADSTSLWEITSSQ